MGSKGIGESVLERIGGIEVLIGRVALGQDTETGRNVVSELPDTEQN